MASSALLAVAFLLPLRLLSLAFRLRLPTSRSAAALLTIAALLTTLSSHPDGGSRPVADAHADALRSEIDALRLKVARLESMLEDNTKNLKNKADILEEDNKLIEAMERDIQLLKNGEASIKVQILQQEFRKINNIAYSIESLANDAEKRVESLSSEVKKIDDIIAEQWIQIRQFEQAFVLTKMMTAKVHERRSSQNAYKWPGKDIVLKASRFRKAISRQCPHDMDRPNVFFLGGSISRSCISLPYNQFEIFMSSAQKIHYKVQVHLQDAMRSNRYSKVLANELITFCLAYLLVISPMWISWFLYSVRFGSKK